MTAQKLTLLTARFDSRAVARIDGYLERLRKRTPGVRFTRSDVLRIGVEELTRVKPAKKVASR